jgi:hypothetical protein
LAGSAAPAARAEWIGGPVFDLLEGPGFLGTNGTLGADISLVVSLPAAPCLNAVPVYAGGSK